MIRFIKFSKDVTDLDDDFYVNPNNVLGVKQFPNPDRCEIYMISDVVYHKNRISVDMSAKRVLTLLQIGSDPDIDN